MAERIGAGGMGVVYAVHHVETGARAALKVLAADVEPELWLRFQREGQTQARVDDHPAILRIHEAGEAWGRPYLVLEFASGGDLAERLRRGPLQPELARVLLGRLAEGVEHLHQAGILHRDLKPENVLFDGEDRPRLTDFGLARAAGAESLTETGTLIGTPAYMAPEQALGQLVDPRADVYGLGAVLYACLTGRAPAEGPTVLAILNSVLEETPPAPSSLVAGIPPDLDAVCARALAKDPQERYSSAGEFALALNSGGASQGRLGLARLILTGLGLTILFLALGLGVATALPEAPSATPSLPGPSSAPIVSATPSPGVRHALDPYYRKQRVTKRRVSPETLRFVAKGRLLVGRLDPSDPLKQIFELWAVDAEARLELLWESKPESRGALVRSGRLAWVKVQPDLRLLTEESGTFPPQEEPYEAASHGGLRVSPNGRRLALLTQDAEHSGTLRLYDLSQEQPAPREVTEYANAAWLGDATLVWTELDPRQGILQPRLFLQHGLPGKVSATRTHPLPALPVALSGSAQAAWVGFRDGSLIEIPYGGGPPRTYAHLPPAQRGGRDRIRGARVRVIGSTQDFLFAATHSDSLVLSQLVAWPRRSRGARVPLEVALFPGTSRPALLAFDPELGLLAVALRDTEHGLWIFRLHE